jgi:hypothetical protein
MQSIGSISSFGEDVPSDELADFEVKDLQGYDM